MNTYALAETDSAGAWTNYIFFGGIRLARNVSGDIKYYISDHLHSTAVFADKTGAILDDNDFYPWGGVVPGVGQTTSNNSIKFTEKYRDTESGLDYFGARYYANAMGRFMSPDWAAKPVTVPYAEFGDPQSLNLYAYVRNNPLPRIDADGHSMGVLNNEGFEGFNFFWDAFESRNGLPTPTPEEDKKNDQQQDKGGVKEKLGNFLTFNGWKTNAEVEAERRQYLTDNNVQKTDAEGNLTAVDWSKASNKQVNEAYKYVRSVERQASANHFFASMGYAVTVTFKTEHMWRHFEGSGLKRADIEAAITEDVNAAVKNATQPTTNFHGRVTVDGRVIEYRAYTLPNGTISVGTAYFPPNP